MTISMHSASVPIFVRMLGNLLKWLDKAEAHATARKFDPAVYLGARLSGVDAPKFADDEASLADLRERVRKTIDFIQSVPAARIDGTEAKDVVVPRRDGSMTLKGETYLKTFVLPNFFFHVTTAYALLRHYGVELGKADFLGPMQPPPAA